MDSSPPEQVKGERLSLAAGRSGLNHQKKGSSCHTIFYHQGTCEGHPSFRSLEVSQFSMDLVSLEALRVVSGGPGCEFLLRRSPVL
jgi:hypothetical protein